MEHIIRLDKVTKEQQDQLKEHLVALIMNENTFLRSVNYMDLECGNPAEQSVTVKFLEATKVELTD